MSFSINGFLSLSFGTESIFQLDDIFKPVTWWSFSLLAIFEPQTSKNIDILTKIVFEWSKDTKTGEIWDTTHLMQG